MLGAADFSGVAHLEAASSLSDLVFTDVYLASTSPLPPRFPDSLTSPPPPFHLPDLINLFIGLSSLCPQLQLPPLPLLYSCPCPSQTFKSQVSQAAIYSLVYKYSGPGLLCNYIGQGEGSNYGDLVVVGWRPPGPPLHTVP